MVPGEIPGRRYVLFAFETAVGLAHKAMNILLKLPSRQRPVAMIARLQVALERADNPDRILPLLAIDSDDEASIAAAARIPSIGLENITIGPHFSKVEAVNRGIANFPMPWDILVVISDDMVCVQQGWDIFIEQALAGDLDRCAHFHDGHQPSLCTLPIMGRSYYERFGYVYHPDYLSLWCDNEQTDVAVRDGKMVRRDTVLFRHDHPAWGSAKMDDLYRRNEALYRRDEKVYKARKAQGFP